MKTALVTGGTRGIGLGIGVVLGVGFPLFIFVWFAAIKTKPIQITGTEEGVY